MKRHLLVTAFFSLLFVASFGQTSSYGGNGKSDFGGAVGLGTINITSTTDSLFFTFAKGPGLFDSIIVIYIDGQPGGVSTTGGSGGNTDVYMRATTGYNTETQQSIVNFPANFQPDAAVAFDKNGGEVLYWFYGFLLKGTSFTTTPTGVNNARAYTASFAKTDLGISAGSTVNLNFLGTYIGANCYRSTEGIGDTSATVSRTARDAAANRTTGYNAYNPTKFFTYSSLNLLAVKLVDFKATKLGSEVAIGWNVAEENSIDQYEVQRSADGIHFTTINTVKATNLSTSTSYNVKDPNPAAGVNYYRLIIDERGRLIYSSVLTINVTSLKNSFTATYAGSSLNVSLSGIKAGNYRLSVLNSNGQLIQAINFAHDGAVVNKIIPLATKVVAGIYRIALQAKDATYVTNVIVQ
ncbi:MAG: hypothetical protein M3040_08175 [Bacteroidota bacterium]|nr:hypothetical protein [Bacteroidota bacterium]